MIVLLGSTRLGAYTREYPKGGECSSCTPQGGYPPPHLRRACSRQVPNQKKQVFGKKKFRFFAVFSDQKFSFLGTFFGFLGYPAAGCRECAVCRGCPKFGAVVAPETLGDIFGNQITSAL